MPVDSSNWTFALFKTSCHANHGAEKNDLGQVHTFQDIYFESFQIHQQQ